MSDRLPLRLDALHHAYDAPAGERRQVLLIEQWCIEGGQQVLMRGVSGSGKTTLLNIMAGLLQPSSGEVYLGEQGLYQLAEAERDRFRAGQIGYAFQNHLLLPAWSALENVMLPLRFAGRFPEREWRSRATALLEVGLGAYLDYRPRQLSTGQRLRVGIARALVNQPALVLADEPTAALDASAGEAVIRLLQGVCAESGATLILASHDPALDAYFPLQLQVQQARFPAGEAR